MSRAPALAQRKECLMKHPVFCLAVAAIAAAQLGMAAPAQGQSSDPIPSSQLGMKVHPMASAAARSSAEGELPSLGDVTAWMNSQPLTPTGLRGRVVLIQFWTYTCINWLRTLPYIRAWSEKYKDNGLLVIGVHTPEFPFEKNIDNVRRAAKDMMIDYPIAIDSDYAVWRTFNNEYWPAMYLVDAQGRMRYHHFGEGEYERS